MRTASGAFCLVIVVTACAKEHERPPPQTTAPQEAPSVGGCRDIFLYAANDERTQFVVIDVDAKMHGLTTPGTKKTFDLTKAPDGVTVSLDVYLKPAVGQIHCTAARTEQQMAERYQASKGTLTVDVMATDVVTARLDGARFVLEGRPSIDVPSRSFDHVKVGWFPR